MRSVYRQLSASSPAVLYVDPVTGGRHRNRCGVSGQADEDGVSVYRELVLHGQGLTALTS